MKSPRNLRGGRELGLTGDGVLLLVIASGVILGCGWVYWNYRTSTEDEARAYAERTVRQLAVVHDPQYFAANLSAVARPLYPLLHQKYLISSLTSLGVPRQPFSIEGTLTYGTDPGRQDPVGHFAVHLLYPAVDVQMYLDVARRQGRWQIDMIEYQGQNLSAAETSSSP